MTAIEKICIENGEVRLIVDPLEYEVRNRAQIEGYKMHIAKQKDTRYFTFAHMESLQEVISSLSNVHLGYLLHLQCFIDLETGFLHNKEGKEMTKKVDIQKTLGVSKDVNKRLCKALENNDILEVVDGKYRINPKYHFSGKSHDQKVVKLFTTTLKRLCKTIKANELGFLYKLLPYVHLKTNMISVNPFEKEPSNIKYLNIQGIAEITGIHEDNIPALIKGLRKGGIIAETKLEDKRSTFITLNPYIFYRKSGTPDDTLKAMFASSPYSSKK